VNRQVLNQDVQAMLWEVETQRYRVRTDVQRRYFQVLAAQRRLAISHKFHEVADQGVDIAQKRFDAQEGSRPDILQAEIQRTEVDLLIRRAEFDLDGSRQALAAVIGIESLPEQTLTGELKSIPVERDSATAYQTLVGSSPELRAAYSRQHRARLNIDRQEIQAIPNPTVQVGGGHDTSTGSGIAGVQVSMAIPAWNKNEGNIEAANADYCRAVQDVRRLELGLKSRLALALKDYNSARVTVEQYQDEILPKAQEALDLSELAYQAGEFDFIRVLTARRQYFEANLQYINALAEYSVADAVIEGLLLSGGLDETMDFDRDDTLRDRAMNNM
jgi:cobalt-zinc-cadmium efflux system outer membrane protein